MDDTTHINSFFLHKLKFLGSKEVWDWCVSIGLLASEYKCPKCSNAMKLAKLKDLSDGFSWRCRPEGKKAHCVSRSIRAGSYFSSSHLSIMEILLITYYWIHKVPAEFIMYELKISKQTVSDWKYYCREICVDICQNESMQVGGNDSVVEVLEGKFGEYKNGRDKRVVGKWVYGGLMRKTKNFFFKVVDYPGKEELLRVIEECVLPHTIIISECCSIYKCHEDENFKQLAEKNSLKFRGSDSKMNFTLKSDPAQAKRRASRRVYKEQRDSSGYFLAECLWHKKYGTNSILPFLKYIKNIYPPETEDTFPINTENEHEHASELHASTSSDIANFRFGIEEE